MRILLQSVGISICLMWSFLCHQASHAQSQDSANIGRLQAQIKKDYNNAQLHYLLGNALVKTRQFDKAKLQYQICLELNPPATLAGYARQALKMINETMEAQASQYNQQAQNQAQVTANAAPQAIAQQPELRGCDYASAPPSTEITLFGAGFSTNRSHDEVSVGGVRAEITAATDVTLKCVIPSTLKSPCWYIPIAVMVDGVMARGKVTINITPRAIKNSE